MELSVDIACPKCAHKMKPGNKLICPGCGVTIELEGDDMGKAADALDDLARSIKSLGRG